MFSKEKVLKRLFAYHVRLLLLVTQDLKKEDQNLKREVKSRYTT